MAENMNIKRTRSHPDPPHPFSSAETRINSHRLTPLSYPDRAYWQFGLYTGDFCLVRDGLFTCGGTRRSCGRAGGMAKTERPWRRSDYTATSLDPMQSLPRNKQHNMEASGTDREAVQCRHRRPTSIVPVLGKLSLGDLRHIPVFR